VCGRNGEVWVRVMGVQKGVVGMESSGCGLLVCRRVWEGLGGVSEGYGCAEGCGRDWEV
jgi:hypothetical protein